MIVSSFLPLYWKHYKLFPLVWTFILVYLCWVEKPFAWRSIVLAFWVIFSRLEFFSNGLKKSGIYYYTIYLMQCSWAVTMSFGNGLLWGIYHYERFGGDPQKRGLQNRIASEIFLSLLWGKLWHFWTLFFFCFRKGTSIYGPPHGPRIKKLYHCYANANVTMADPACF